jgi:Nif-specific regulatory protein
LCSTFADLPAPKPAQAGDDNDDTQSFPDGVPELSEPEPTITHRRGHTRLLAPGADEQTAPQTGRAAARLCRLAFELAKAPDLESLARLALGSLFQAAAVDAGAVLLCPPGEEPDKAAEQMAVLVSRSDSHHPYYRASKTLAATVLREGEAVLARNVIGDSKVSSRDSKGEIHATSVICAPIGRGKAIHGLLHLYSTNAARVPTPDDLEFTLAVADTLAVALANLARRQELAENLSQVKSENQQLRERLGVQTELVGTSPAVAKIMDAVARVAPTNATVLVRGESGVGKELVARAVHYNSPRRKGVFICLNCAALSETLLESELFGHEKGAFTGATERKVGKFEAAHRGTLLLDEIGEMSPSLQSKFLRVLEGHPFERVGGSEPVKVDVRVIAATNRDLERDVADGRFRRDLFFRLHVVEIVVPPLRRRPEDIPELAHYFLRRFNTETGRRICGFTPAAMEQMLRYRWPGNVRELKNVVERALVLAEGDYIDTEHLMLSRLVTAGDTGELPPAAAPLPPTQVPPPYKPLSLADMERQHIIATLRATGWNKSQTANILGIERSTLDRKIRRYEITDGYPRRFTAGQ